MFSPKQLQILKFPYQDYDMLICDGAIRSGKTSIMMIAFVNQAMINFNNQNFAICGKTVGSAIKNIIEPFMGLNYTKKNYDITFTRSDNKVIIRRGGKLNTFYIYGGKDESSYMLIQGITLAGLFMDEIALMVESFVMQAMGRCSVEKSKIFCNCNPSTPLHFFYTDYILKSEEHKALHLHFEMKDNPSLSEEKLKQYESRFSGIFYDRYIRGLWVVAEGLVYPMFNKDFHVVPTVPRPYERFYISNDFGIQHPCVFQLWGLADKVWYCIKEYCHEGQKGVQKTVEEYYNDLIKFAEGYPIKRIFLDNAPIASSFNVFLRRKSFFATQNADNSVLSGIQDVSTALSQGLIKYNDCCVDLIREKGLYSWNEKAATEEPVKENDDSSDCERYFVHTLQIAQTKFKRLS